jgi:hypothetical protein
MEEMAISNGLLVRNLGRNRTLGRSVPSGEASNNPSKAVVIMCITETIKSHMSAHKSIFVC